MQAAVLRRNLDYANKVLEHRAEVGEIAPEERKELLKRYAADLIEQIKVDRIPDAEAWEYGDIFKTAEVWDKAKIAYEKAIRSPRNEDRRVNDTLRLALCEAHLGNVARAIELARSVFDVTETGKAPILPAVLLEIVPAGENKGQDEDLANLLWDAIKQHQMTVVDPKTEGGRAFVRAKPIHIRDAYRKVVQLFTRAGRHDEADHALREGLAVMQSFGHTRNGEPVKIS